MFLIPPYLASTDALETSFLTYGDFFRSELYFHSISHLTTLYKESNYKGKGQLVSYTWAFCGTYDWRDEDEQKLWSIPGDKEIYLHGFKIKARKNKF